jgi:uncharacterized protein (TIGR03437 family)
MRLHHLSQLLSRFTTRRTRFGALLFGLLLCGLALNQLLSRQLPEQRAGRERDKLDQSKLFDQPDEAAEYFLRKRLPAGEQDLPVEKYTAAWQHMRGMQRYSTALGRQLNAREFAPALGTWSFLGPGNVGGRTRAWVIHPTAPETMWAAGVAGGVWKTTNGGASWTPTSDLTANLAICTLTLATNDPNVIYAGTGESFAGTIGVRGNGVFKTSDGGATWTQLSATANNQNFHFVNRLVVSPDGQRVYAATTTGVWRSLDGGASWTQSLAQPSCDDLLRRTDQAGDFLFVSCRPGNQGTISRNLDAGGAGAWEPVQTETGMNRVSLALAPSNQSTVYALASASSVAGGPNNNYISGLHAVFRSTNDGAAGSWTARVRNTDATFFNTLLLSNPSVAVCNNRFVNQGHYDNVIAVDPADPNRVWAGGVSLFRSDDGGANWGIAGCAGEFHVDIHAIVFHPQYNGTSNKTMFVGNDGGVYKTTDARAGVRTQVCGTPNCAGQVNFTSLNTNYGVTQFYHGLPYPDGRTFFGGSQDNGTQRGSEGSGVNGWSEIFGGDGGYVAIDPNNTNVLYAETQNGGIRKSTNGGTSFTPATTGINDPRVPFIMPFVMDPSNAQRLWTGGSRIWRTDNGAANWVQAALPLTNDTVSALAVAPTNANQVLVGTAGGFIHRTNVGTTSDANTNWPSVRPRGGFVSWVAYDPKDINIAYATYSTFNSAPNQRHVYRSADGGATWAGLDGTGASSLPDVPVHCIVVDPINSNHLYVGTDVGVFSSIDGGVTWAVENTGFANVITEALAVNTGGGAKQLFAFTHGRGAWRVALNTVNCPAISIAQTTLPNGALNANYNQTLTASGGTAPLTFSLSAGALPAGLTLSASGVLTGTPSAPGSFTFAVRVTDASGCIGARVFTLQINCQSITVGPAALPAPRVGVAYSQQLTATGGIGGVSFALFNTQLPPGLTLEATGVLSGTPTTAGTFVFAARATDSNGCFGVRTYSLTVTSAAQNPVPVLASLNPNSAVAGSVAFTLLVTGTNFVNGSIGRWNGADRATAFISGTQLRIAITAADLANAGTISVSVFNPAPGGGTSNALPFRIGGQAAFVSGASFAGGALATESIVAAFGVNLASRLEVATSLPLPTSLGGTTVIARDAQGVERACQLFFVSPGQINFQLPPGTPTGTVVVTVNGETGFSTGTINVAQLTPGLFAANATGQGVASAIVLRVAANGAQSFEPVARFDQTQNRFVPLPIDLGPAGDQLFLIAFGTGFRFNNSANPLAARIGGAGADLLFAGAQGDFIGLDQANIAIPRSLQGRGEVGLTLGNGDGTSNMVLLNIK